MKLVIVESPAKCATIQKYLGDEYIVKASLGHIRDLSTRGKGGLGVDVNNNFTPDYIINKDKKKVIYDLIETSKKADEVILATDPDREGEAIAWHLAVVLGLDINVTKRLEFHEITPDSIKEAMENPRTIDMKLVSSQETRRILDRIIGFKLSTLLYKKIKSQSAGRVQSAALKLIKDHDDEINSFVPEEYYEIKVEALNNNKEVKLTFNKDKDGNKEIKTKESADSIINSIGNEFVITNIEKSIKVTESKPPFSTSSLQQEAFSKLKFSTKKTSLIAQALYEGIEVNGEHVGLITYIRTDATRLSEIYVNKSINFISDKYGKEYVGAAKKGKANNFAQDAHEAIRPTSNSRTPESIRGYLTSDQYSLYKLIYNRALASLMKPKKDEILSLTLDNNGNTFKVSYNHNIFLGYQYLYKYDENNEENKNLPSVNVGDIFTLKSKVAEQKFTTPPSRYSEAKLVALMEEVGIGRPSTYASTIATIKQRKYVLDEKGIFSCTEQGRKTITVLNKYFPGIINASYTADMEAKLDQIQEDKTTSLKVLDDFYKPFIELVERGYELMYKDENVETGERCPKCGSPLVYKEGRNGSFVACSNYPTCKYVKKTPKEVTYLEETCPECGKPLVVREKNGKKFIGCSGFPTCKYIRPSENETKESKEPVKICPKCGSPLVKKRGTYGYFLGCSNYPNCNYMEKIKRKR